MRLCFYQSVMFCLLGQNCISSTGPVITNIDFFSYGPSTPGCVQRFRISLLSFEHSDPKQNVFSLLLAWCLRFVPVAEAATLFLRFTRNCVLCDFISCWEALILPERYARWEGEEQAKEIFKWFEQRMWGNMKSAGGEKWRMCRGHGQWKARREHKERDRWAVRRRKGGIKGTEEGRMLIHYYPWRRLPMSLSEHLGRAEASCGAIKEETRWRGCRSCTSHKRTFTGCVEIKTWVCFLTVEGTK